MSVSWPQLVLGFEGTTATTVAVLVGAALFGGVMVTILVLISRSIRELRRGAARLAEGNLSERLAVRGPLQLAAVSESLNAMAAQLANHLAAVVRQRNELSAIVSSMMEGVIAIDTSERVISINGAAAELLELDMREALGRSIQEVVRNASLQSFVSKALQAEGPISGEVNLFDASRGEAGDRSLQAQAAALRGASDERIGAVIVFHDVTRLRRLEQVRRDFVANVSHELRTPISTIKAAAETLLEDEEADGEARRRFLDIIVRQADRQESIVEDLLNLARIEQQEGRSRSLVPMPVRPVLESAKSICGPVAGSKRIRLDVRCEEGLTALVDAELLETAISNLVDNAVKYSPPETLVLIWAEASGGEVRIAVTDQGPGIEAKHIPRIFERFYRTDKARSRALGGTGLGLSIVKHIAQAMGGRASVESAPGRGSTFRIHLPQAMEASPVAPAEEEHGG